MHVYGELSGTLTSAKTIQGTLSAAQTIQGNITVPSAILPPSYEGEYTVTPSAETQTLNTDHLYMMDNITINPIPNNYGVTITVS